VIAGQKPEDICWRGTKVILDEMRILLIYNPTAGDDDVEPAELVSELEAAGHEVVSRSVKKDGWEQSLDADFDLVVAAGGDGTVVKVFKQLAGTDTPATLFPVGSANNIAGSIGFDDVDLRRLTKDSAEASFDIGSIAWNGGRERFVESAGGGIFAEMIARAEEMPTPNGEDKVELGLRLLREIVDEAEPQRWQLRADGKDRSGGFLAVEAMNVRQLGPNVPLVPDADPGDGLLDLVLVREADRSALTAYLDARLESRSAELPRLETHRVREIAIEPPDGSRLHVDDELLQTLSGGITVRIDSRVRVLAPRKGESH
jgi:diacylglycerol kinase (ATP)